METFLLTWNPKKTPWVDLDRVIARFATTRKLRRRWSTGVTRNIPIGSRVFLMRVGITPKGLMGSGHTVSKTYPDDHWLPEHANRQVPYVDIDWDVLTKVPVISHEEL